ncbi:MarR family winged helix-turn-helix transcriptional regulator [Bacillus paranthracis]|uniref:MarR family transcriptional regulator n=24 Tax=Bacillus cereus group TaxID=86661 RepID=A0A0E1N510_BACAN|nr:MULTISPECIES: MarR family transcriptional regulator [Bacillus]ACJ81442.1 transcriptional regulator, MarR family [Bacillus cereus AH187]ADY20763.1 MarR family transcriptional regulator [Bacillus thuringiensis serovar finitimus YBT-020]EDX56043.1 transcriptional regulator, MarR family [Bacillus cereus W]EDX67153.1 transcriptional regulator, MarR family [Bacillus cereus NVH0597-99]EDZ55596.1 transcriptional regulator, MarR family [Bacillus cereus H3081.97]EEL46587.1 Transcriptional regulator,
MSQNREQLMEELSTNVFAMFRTLRNDIGKIFGGYIPWNEFIVLRILNRTNKEMVSRVANELNVSNSHITAVTEKLINKGFVTRSRSTSDRRVVYLEITEQGKDLVAKMEGAKKQYLQERFSTLSEEEMNIMISISKKLI